MYMYRLLKYQHSAILNFFRFFYKEVLNSNSGPTKNFDQKAETLTKLETKRCGFYNFS